MTILDGKKIAEKILRNLRKEIEKKQLKIKLAVILTNRDRVSVSFVRQIKKGCQRAGVGFKIFELSFKKEIQKVIKDPDNSGIVIVGRKNFSNLIPPEKNVEKISPVVCAVERILKEYKISLRGKNVTLVGRGRLAGRPLAKWLRKKKIKFSNIDKIKKADIIISGVGKPGLITGDMVKRGVVVIDIGRDVDFKAISKKASYITPLIGGVGPVTVACLLQNLVWMSTCSKK